MIVLGMGFGDEGKGLTTSYLCSKVKAPIVVRFSGGHQAGHTVVHEGIRHTFSNFGSGTLQGAVTYWSKFCTVCPVGIFREAAKLNRNDLKLILHPLCPITTPYDKQQNQALEGGLKHGSVGVGFGTTLQRQEDNYQLFVQDLFYPQIFKQKMERIKGYYEKINQLIHVPEKDLINFMLAVEWLTKFVEVREDSFLYANAERVIFEGSQGIMLDKDFGFFPNVTRSNTTSKNVFEMPNAADDVFYVTRCYQTRHGNGFMTNEVKDLGLVNNENEANTSNKWQGDFRVGHLDKELLNYALACDHHFSKGLRKNLVITCLDQFKGTDAETIIKSINTDFDKVFVSHGPSWTDIQQIR